MESLHLKGGAYSFIAALLLILTSCMDNNSETVQPVPVGYVSIYHAAPDAPQLDVIVDDRKINFNPLSYSDHSGYLNFYTGDRTVKFTSSGAVNTLVDTVLNVEDGNAYSIFVINQLSNLETLVVRDSAATPSSGKAMIRFVQLSPDSPELTVTNTNAAGANLFEGVSFKQATAFKEIDAAPTSFEIKSSDGSNVLLSATNVHLRPGNFYTIITRGFKNPPAGNTNVLSMEVL
jgi:hypothetical protein